MTRWPAVETGRWISIGLLALVVVLTGLGNAPFFDRDEGEYVTVARNMIERGDWVVPRVNGRSYYEKPALYFWATAISFKLFGYNEFAGRLPSALAGLALMAMMGWFGRRQIGERFGQLSTLLAASTFLMALMARVALMDVMLTLFITLSLTAFFEGCRSPAGQDRVWFLTAWAAMGLAFLTKGPVGAIVPVTATFFYSLANRNFIATLKRVRPLSGVLVFSALAAPWYVLVLIREGRPFWQGFFLSQNLGRFTDVVLGHGAPVWYYIPVLAVMAWPWFFFALPRLYTGLVGRERKRRAVDPDAELDFFLGVWLVSCLVVFSAAATKQPNYVLPAVPPLLFLSASWFDRWLSDDERRTRTAWILTVSAVVIGLALAAFFLAAGSILPSAIAKARIGVNPDSFEYAFPPGLPDLTFCTPLWAGLMAILTLAALYAFAKNRRRTFPAALTAASFVFIFGFSLITGPSVLDYLQTPAKEIATEAKNRMEAGDRLAAFGLYKPTLWFYTAHDIERITSLEKDKLRETLVSPDRVFILSRLSLLPELELHPEFRLLRTEGGYILGVNKAAGP